MGEAFDINAWSAYWFAIDKDCPGKTWWNCPPTHPAIYRALGINPNDDGAVYACAPFRIHKSEDGVRVLAAHPAPALFDEPDCDWLGIDTVISWNPVNDSARVVGDPSPQIVGNLSDETNVIYASPLTFFRHWARRRAQFLMMRQQAASHRWNKPPAEQDQAPGVLMIGAPSEIKWRPAQMPIELECSGVSPAVINKELLKAARVPRARGSAA